jgi:hypothetical protein
MSLCGELAYGEAMDPSQNRLHNGGDDRKERILKTAQINPKIINIFLSQ